MAISNEAVNAEFKRYQRIIENGNKETKLPKELAERLKNYNEGEIILWMLVILQNIES